MHILEIYLNELFGFGKKKSFVDAYAKIYTDDFPPIQGEMTGDELFKILTDGLYNYVIGGVISAFLYDVGLKEKIEKVKNIKIRNKMIVDIFYKETGIKILEADIENYDKEILGDKVIWYLGCNEKVGNLQYKDLYKKEWSFGGSSFDYVQKWVDIMFKDKFISSLQYNDLNKLIKEGRQIDDMYQIGLYLLYKQNNKPWKRSKSSMRDDAKKYFGDVKKDLEDKGFTVYT